MLGRASWRSLAVYKFSVTYPFTYVGLVPSYSLVPIVSFSNSFMESGWQELRYRHGAW